MSAYDLDNTRFFELEGKTLCAGNRTFQLTAPDLKGESAVRVPFGIKKFEEKQLLTVQLEGEVLQNFKNMEQELRERLEKQCPEFLVGAQQQRSLLKGDKNDLLNFKVNDSTKWNYFDVKKSAFVKGKVDQVLPGSRVCVSFTIRSPWKMEISSKQCWGFSLSLDEVIVYFTPEAKAKSKPQKKRELKDEIQDLLKQRTKMQKYKKDEEDDDE